MLKIVSAVVFLVYAFFVFGFWISYYWDKIKSLVT